MSSHYWLLIFLNLRTANSSAGCVEDLPKKMTVVLDFNIIQTMTTAIISKIMMLRMFNST